MLFAHQNTQGKLSLLSPDDIAPHVGVVTLKFLTAYYTEAEEWAVFHHVNFTARETKHVWVPLQFHPLSGLHSIWSDGAIPFAGPGRAVWNGEK